MSMSNVKINSAASLAILRGRAERDTGMAPESLDMRLEFAIQGDMVDARRARQDAPKHLEKAAMEALRSAAAYAIDADSDGAARAARLAIAKMNALDESGEDAAIYAREARLLARASADIAQKSARLCAGAQTSLDLFGGVELPDARRAA